MAISNVFNTIQPQSLAADKENFTSSAPNSKAAAVVAPVRSLTGRRRRARTNGSSSSPYHAAQQAARRQTRSPATRNSLSSRDVEMSEVSFTASVESSKVKITFPTHLQQPAYREINRDTLAALNPEFEDVPIDYIHDKLRGAGAELLKAVAATSVATPCSSLPKELEVVISDQLADNVPAPTHMLALFTKDKPRPGTHRQVKLFPVHEIVLAAHCAHLPAFPRPAPGSAALPVVTLCLPNTSTFPALQHFLYTRRTEVLLASLLPAPQPGVPVEQTAQYLAATYTPTVLTAHLLRVHALWSNVCVLGIFDDALWRAIDLAWDLLMAALACAGPSGVTAESH